MLSTITGVTAATAVGLISATAGAQAVQWRIEDGGNGHWYGFESFQTPKPWHMARELSALTGGYLACIGSLAEQQFLISIAPNYQDESGGQAWLGGYQDTATADFAEPHGGWRWVSGEELTFVGWVNAGTGWGADFMTLAKDINGNFGWNDLWSDYFGGRRFAFTEWSADCNKDGIVDYGQCRDGSLADDNGNNIPDCCEAGIPCPACAACDLNPNGVIDGSDLGALLAFWGPVSPAFPRADINRDGTVNGADLSTLLANWGPCPG